MKKSLIFILLLSAMLVLGLAACDGVEIVSLGDISQHEPEPAATEEVEDIDLGDEVPGNLFTREDEDGLVTVQIGGGGAEISFNAERWEELGNGSGEIAEGPFPIETVSGGVVDAIVGKVPILDAMGEWGIVAPTVALLTEQGRVEYFLADPYFGNKDSKYSSYGVVPWLTDIVSFSYEEDSDEYWGMAIYLWDDEGYKYNLRLLSNLLSAFDEDGVWKFFTPTEWGEMYIGMVLSEDGGMELEIGSSAIDGEGYDIEQTYSGSYEVFFAENGDRDPGKMVVDLKCTWWIAELGEKPDPADQAYWDERMHITGTYDFYSEGNGGSLNMKLVDGDALMHYNWRGVPITEYEFWQTFI